MSLDQRASAAACELLEQLPPDAERMLRDLKRTRVRRALARSATLMAAIVLVIGTTILVTKSDDAPDPAKTAGHNGAIVAPPDNSAGAWRHFTAFGADLRLPQDAAPFAEAQFTADGSRLVYPGPRRTIQAIDVATGDTRTLGDCLDDLCYPALSPDGTRLAYGAEDHLKIQTIDTGDAERILTPGVESTAMPAWSPDGSTIAFTGPRGLYTVDVELGGVRRVHRPADRNQDFVAASWSPDGASIAFLALSPIPGDPNHETRFTAMTVRADGSDPRELHDAGHCACLGLPAPSLTWSPDGKLIAVAVTQSADGAGIFTIRPDGTGWTLLHGGIYADVDWQPVY